jgi:hypothetical protein
MKLGVFFVFGSAKGPYLHRTAHPRFSPRSAGSSVLDALWIVAIILEQPAYALVVPSGQSAWIAHFVAPGVAQNKNPN